VSHLDRPTAYCDGCGRFVTLNHEYQCPSCKTARWLEEGPPNPSAGMAEYCGGADDNISDADPGL
jgi:hypothetical protein